MIIIEKNILIIKASNIVIIIKSPPTSLNSVKFEKVFIGILLVYGLNNQLDFYID